MEKKSCDGEKDGDKMKKSNSSRYVEYSKEVLDQSADKRRGTVFPMPHSVHRVKEWLTRIFGRPNEIPEDVVVLRVNYNDRRQIRRKEIWPKLWVIPISNICQVDSTGKEITKWNGGQTEEL